MTGELATVGRHAAEQVTLLSLPEFGFVLACDYDQLGRLTDFSSLPAAAPLPVPGTQGVTYDENRNREPIAEDGYAITATRTRPVPTA